MGGSRLASQQKKADLGPSHMHNLTVSRSCCRTPGCYQRGGQQLLRQKNTLHPQGVRMSVSCRADRTFWMWVLHGTSACGSTASPVSSGTTIGLDSLGSGGSGVLESCQCSAKQPGWPVP